MEYLSDFPDLGRLIFGFLNRTDSKLLQRQVELLDELFNEGISDARVSAGELQIGANSKYPLFNTT